MIRLEYCNLCNLYTPEDEMFWRNGKHICQYCEEEYNEGTLEPELLDQLKGD